MTKDFQTADYDELCGCVGVLVPSACNHAYNSHGVERANPGMTRMLLEQSKGARVVCVNCPKCGGSGILPQRRVA